jgi:prepilin-type N-terminal cleavage/methylation domain-containing protein
MKIKFTLIEIIVAIAILALGLLSAMSMSSFSKYRIDKAYKKWKMQHMLSQASEYYLLVGANTDIPHIIFPYKNMQASCSVIECKVLPEDIDVYFDQWLLGTYHVEIVSNGKILRDIKIDKIVNKNEI